MKEHGEDLQAQRERADEREHLPSIEFNEAVPDLNDRQPEQDPGTALAAKTRHLLDVYEALGVAWGADPFTAIRRLKNRAAAMPAPNLYESIPLFGYELVMRERVRQITQEGWTEEHDDEHTDQSLAIVAAMYAIHGVEEISVIDTAAYPEVPDAWPSSWAEDYDKRNEHPRIRCLVIAGALICAEIDRLQRLADQNERDEAARIRATLATDAAGDL